MTDETSRPSRPTKANDPTGDSEGYPILSHMNQTAAIAERLRARREAVVGRPCFVVPMAAWFADPLGALRGAQGMRGGGP